MAGYGARGHGLDRPALVAAVAEVLDGALRQGASAVVAVSGGPDSCALAALVAEARPDLRLTVGHVRHGLREDAADARSAADLAGALGLPYAERRVAVVVSGEGPEAAARAARYAALASLAQARGDGVVLVGHTADDRAETLLLNLARGSGLRGLSAMRAVATRDPAEAPAEAEVRIIRPLLGVRRADVRTFVEGEGLTTVTDPTNADVDQRRRRVRAEVLPALARLSGAEGDPVGALTRLADLAADDADALDALAAGHARRLVAGWGPAGAVPRRELLALPRALATRVLRLLLARARGGVQGLPAAAVTAALELRPGQALDVPGGVRVTCGGGWLAAVPGASAGFAPRPVRLPGRTPLPELDLVLNVDVPRRRHTGQGVLPLPDTPARDPDLPAPAGEVVAPPGATQRGWDAVVWHGGEWRVRPRRPGDRIRLAGGSRKVQDVLTDAGVPRALRDLVPILVDASDEPLWLPGLAVRVGGEGVPARCWLSRATPSAVGSA